MNKKKSSIVTTLFGNDKSVYLTPNRQTSKSDKKINSASFYDAEVNKIRSNKDKENTV